MPIALVDHLGRPIDFKKLKEEVAAPTIASARQIISGHAASGLTPGRLAATLRQAEAGDPVAYFELAEQMEEKDLHYLSVLGTRKRQVSQLEITVESATDDADDVANADLVRDWLKRDTLEDDLFDILDAVGKGFSVNEIIWSMSESQWWPDRIEFVDPRWIRFDPVTGRQPLLVDDTGQGQPLDAFKYVYHRVRAKSGLAVRSGLARPVAWAWMFKNYGVKDWVAFAEVYGMPLRLGRYDNGASTQDKQTLLRAVADIGADAAAIVPKSMDIEFIDGKGASSDGALYKNMAEWFDFQISKAVLGQTATTDSVTGGLGSGAEHNDVRGDIERADAKSLGSSLGLYIVRPLVDVNRGPPTSGKYPQVRVGRSESWDVGTMMPAIAAFVKMGGRVEKSVIGDRLGLPEAPEDADVLVPEATADVAQEVAQEPDAPPGGRQAPPKPANAAAAASQAVSGRGAGPTVASSKTVEAAADPIDKLIADALGDGDWIETALLAGVDQLMGETGDLVTLRDRLAEAMAGMDVTALQDLLARSSFNARLAGAAGLELAEEETQ